MKPKVIVVEYVAKVPWAPHWRGYCRACPRRRQGGIRHYSKADSDKFWANHADTAEHRDALRAWRRPSEEARLLAQIFGGPARSEYSLLAEERAVNKWYLRLKEAGHKTTALRDVGRWSCVCGESGPGSKSDGLPHLRAASEALGIRPMA